jgi:heme exporter protein D
MMHWESWQSFWAMGGYAFFVWSSFGMTALLIILECWQLKSAWKKELTLLHSAIELDQDLAALQKQPSRPLDEGVQS